MTALLLRKRFKLLSCACSKLLGRSDAIDVSEGRISLNPQLCWVDAVIFERLFDQTQKNDGNEDCSAKALELYQGNFLGSDAEEPWAIAARERLRGKFTFLVDRLGKQKERANHWRQAMELYLRGLDADNFDRRVLPRLDALPPSPWQSS